MNLEALITSPATTPPLPRGWQGNGRGGGRVILEAQHHGFPSAWSYAFHTWVCHGPGVGTARPTFFSYDWAPKQEIVVGSLHHSSHRSGHF